MASSLVCVQGLGFVGTANAVAIASARARDGAPLHRVIGVELPTEPGRARAEAIGAGQLPFAVSDASLAAAARRAHEAGNLTATTDESAYDDADVIVVNIGLDIEEKGSEPTFRLAPFTAALTTVGRRMRPNALVLLESTVPPGTCETIAAPLLRKCLAERGLASRDLRLAYCYERVMPGEHYLSSVVDIWRVYAGLTPEAADAADAFLSSYINVSQKPLRRLPNIRAAEMAKVLENTYRAVNIALIDEWERFARRIGIDLFEVLEAIRVRPTHQNIRYPGLGVGGYCLSKDPLFGAASARLIFGLQDQEFPLSIKSVAINDSMPQQSVEALDRLLGGLTQRRIVILGASYREGVGDTRLSPSIALAATLLQHGARVEMVDPLVEATDEIEVPISSRLPDVQGFDAVVLAVAHREYKALDLVAWAGAARPVVFDANGVFGGEALQRLVSAGFKVGAIGRAVGS